MRIFKLCFLLVNLVSFVNEFIIKISLKNNNKKSTFKFCENYIRFLYL